MIRLQPVILSGGSGTRLWPLSRRAYPKQFLALLDEDSLLQATAARLDSLGDAAAVAAPVIVCNDAHRFLVADEVGLGKTLVARGIIAKTIDHLWDTVRRIDIVYICSNGSIARQNLRKLHVTGSDERSFELATRLTMLAKELAPRAGTRSMATASSTS